MKRILVIATVMALAFSANAAAHFGMVIPSDNMVMEEDERAVDVVLSFSHPFEMVGMELEKPARFTLTTQGGPGSLLDDLEKTEVMDHTAWKTRVPVRRPGLYTFYMEPKPYWEPAEDCFIVHHTKTVVAAYGADEGWSEPLGVKTEIVPLSKPFALWAGNVFQGKVLLDGKPVSNAEVEVEYYNADKKAEAPSEYMITQTVQADENGVFTYAAPVPGWWGFAALNGADYKLEHKGEKKDVELGAVLWVHFEPWKTR
ncbi:MAG: DUF4198 domain-containing protein [Desulfatibacillaceae bacterium]